MTDAIALLWPPFLVALCLIGIHTYFGIQVLARNVIFVDLALAQIAALGATMAFMLGHPTQGSATYIYSLAFTLLAAFLLAFTRNWSRRTLHGALRRPSAPPSKRAQPTREPQRTSTFSTAAPISPRRLSPFRSPPRLNQSTI